MQLKPYKNIDEYIANFPTNTQVILEKIRTITREVAPGVTSETIRYGVPTIQIKGKNRLHFGAYARHVALYPASDEMINAIPAISEYRTGKGTLQFRLDKPIPFALIAEVIKYLLT